MIDILQLDESFFRWINNDLHHPFFDAIIPYWRSKYIWAPLYIFIISFILINYEKKGLIYICVLLLTVGLADVTSSRIIKKNVKRVRPCNNDALKNDVKLLIPCGSGYSFTSSHATNHFAIALFLIFTLGRNFRWIKLPLFLWAASIAFSQVYVGVHYPLDVLIGMFLGMVIGSIMSTLYWQLKESKLIFNPRIN